jgi:hypothetical protein
VFQPQYQNYNMGNPMSISQYGQQPSAPQTSMFGGQMQGGGYGQYGTNNPFSAYSNSFLNLDPNLDQRTQADKVNTYRSAIQSGFGDQQIRNQATGLFGQQSPQSWSDLQNLAGYGGGGYGNQPMPQMQSPFSYQPQQQMYQPQQQMRMQGEMAAQQFDQQRQGMLSQMPAFQQMQSIQSQLQGRPPNPQEISQLQMLDQQIQNNPKLKQFQQQSNQKMQPFNQQQQQFSLAMDQPQQQMYQPQQQMYQPQQQMYQPSYGGGYDDFGSGARMQSSYQQPAPQPMAQRTSSGPRQAIVGRSSQSRGTPNVMRRAEGGITSLMDEA